MEAHIDLIRNDWQDSVQSLVARIFVSENDFGLIVKDTTSEHYENNIFDALGQQAKALGREIVSTLQRMFHGPYLMASDLHSDERCPFTHGSSLAIEQVEVRGEFSLPRHPGSPL
ncbi:MAG: hypothetical protein ACRDYY_13160 [Acidimicrobiales bacterium]